METNLSKTGMIYGIYTLILINRATSSIWGLSYDAEHFSGPAYEGKATASSCTGAGCAAWWTALTQAVFPNQTKEF